MYPIKNGKNLKQIAKDNKTKYINSLPFAHIVLEDLFDNDILEKVLLEFPDLSLKNEANHYSGITDEKFSSPRGTKFQNKNTRDFLNYLNSSEFIDFLQELTSIKESLIPDPHFLGGGLHLSKKGGFLKIHTDYCKHPETNLDRRVNLLIFLNKNWKEKYNGYLNFFDKKMTKCVKKIPPNFNTTVIFNTTDFTYHGVPDPILCPNNQSRKSLALYYFSNGRPKSEIRSKLKNQSTLYKERKGEIFLRNFNSRDIISLFIPPIFKNIYYFLKKIKN
ncbi:MAG: proline hydroxylase [Euryarchaeota archaeon]|nr:proline hydroxylase [Euryarchaeota archaeon]|tara:strand:+ start:12054 stop:12881 length:828 start_codon:yes stop_codon:yes gene_type:complete